MAKEIERKFLLADDSWRNDVAGAMRMSQGYLANGDRASVRIRVAGEQAHLNVKSGGLVAVRDEFEYAIPLDAAAYMLATLAEHPLIEKTRHWVPHGDLVWEIDEFHGSNSGLLVAEIELDTVGQRFDLPPWLGAEVTHLHRYYNVSLVKTPYSVWAEAERHP